MKHQQHEIIDLNIFNRGEGGENPSLASTLSTSTPDSAYGGKLLKLNNSHSIEKSNKSSESEPYLSFEMATNSVATEYAKKEGGGNAFKDYENTNNTTDNLETQNNTEDNSNSTYIEQENYTTNISIKQEKNDGYGAMGDLGIVSGIIVGILFYAFITYLVSLYFKEKLSQDTPKILIYIISFIIVVICSYILGSVFDGIIPEGYESDFKKLGKQ